MMLLPRFAPNRLRLGPTNIYLHLALVSRWMAVAPGQYTPPKLLSNLTRNARPHRQACQSKSVLVKANYSLETYHQWPSVHALFFIGLTWRGGWSRRLRHWWSSRSSTATRCNCQCIRLTDGAPVKSWSDKDLQ
jgi:hypothetical protein